jgi:hypothetical protein
MTSSSFPRVCEGFVDIKRLVYFCFVFIYYRVNFLFYFSDSVLASIATNFEIYTPKNSRRSGPNKSTENAVPPICCPVF